MKKLTTQTFIQKVKEIHHHRYDYSLVEYINTRTKVKIICPIHGVFEQQPSNHIQGQTCPKCKYDQISTNLSHNTNIFIQKVKEIYHHEYDYSLVEYINNKTKVKIICPIHGVFEQTPKKHLNGQKCPKCSRISGSNKQKNTIQEFVSISTKIHNNKYDYTLVEYINNKTKVKIICPIHGVFEQRPDCHIYGQGCPKCISIISKQETELQDWLRQYIDIECNDRQIIKPLELDIVIPEHKLCIEYNGLYWHSEQQGKDKRYHLNKYNLCKDQGYRLITIWENEWLFKQDIVKSIVLNAIGIHQRKIHGRKCVFGVVSSKEARIMYDNNHIQGFKGGLHHGLYYKDELVSLMTIDKRGELQRFVNLRYTKIHGSFSKLLKTFNIKDGLYTFADTRYFTGNVYSMNGFEYVYTSSPNYWYFKKINDLMSRICYQKHKLKDKLDIYDPNLSEYQNMLNNGYNRIWDNGNRKYIYNRTASNIV